MLYYQEGFCNGYRQSMPVVYEKGSDGRLHKSKMYCESRKGCNTENCECFQNAPETVRECLTRELPY